MGNMFLFALIVAIASALVLIPIYQNGKASNKKGPRKIPNESSKSKEGRGFVPGAIIAVIVILIPSVFAYYYFSNYDRNLSSLWVLTIIVTALGALVSTGMERKVKALLFAASLLLGIYFLTAFL